MCKEEEKDGGLMQLAKDLTPEGEQVTVTLNALLLMTEQELEELKE